VLTPQYHSASHIFVAQEYQETKGQYPIKMLRIQSYLLLFVLLLTAPIVIVAFGTIPASQGFRIRLHSTETEDDNNLEWISSELVKDQEESDELDWMPDRDKAKILREQANAFARPVMNAATEKPARSSYTEEEEGLIRDMGGKVKANRREPGFLGDCTLKEIATDYSVPVCYMADVLCMWGVPVPINVNDRLGDLVTGEQAFSLLEAIHTLDVAFLQDRYSNDNLLALCDWHDIDIKDAFQMAMKEGWSLPFGVQTFLRVEQEDELIRVLG